MNQPATFRRKLYLGAFAIAVWLSVHAVALAQEGEGGGGGGGNLWLFSYAAVILCIALGMLAVCFPSRMRDRPKTEEYQSTGLADMVIGAKQVPVISVGMRIDQVNKMLGKPRVSRRGQDIYRELAETGRLSEEEAEKVYSIYDHPAGRYEIVSLDRQVIQIKTQPSAKKG